MSTKNHLHAAEPNCKYNSQHSSKNFSDDELNAAKQDLEKFANESKERFLIRIEMEKNLRDL